MGRIGERLRHGDRAERLVAPSMSESPHALRGGHGASRSPGSAPAYVGLGDDPARRRDRRHAVGADLRALRAEARSLPLLLLVPAHLGPGDGCLVLGVLPAAEEQARTWRGRAEMSHVNTVTFVVLIGSFLIVTFIGFASARWRPAEDPMQLNEWGLGGRGFGTFVSWFLLGGDLYTAYTFIAVPALVYATGAAGFYALSYTIMVFPIVFVFGPRLWSVARARGYVTPGEFVRGRYGSQGLGLAVTLTGILATMPYIALQLVGIESVLAVMGVSPSSGNAFVANLPLVIAFVILAAYTYLAGLRAPALIAFVKDTLIYVTVIVAIIYIPGRLGGWAHIFGAASAHLKTAHPATGVLAARRRDVIRRNAAMLPAYTLVLGLIALLGYMARATPAVNAGVAAGGGNAQLSVPLLFQHMFPSWFAGIGYSAIVIGALVPAAILSIAPAQLF